MLLLLLLFAGHALCDFPWQNDFLSRSKNPRSTLEFRRDFGEHGWILVMFAHALIHAGMVAWLTGSVVLGLAEFLIHAVVDYWRCFNRLTFTQDQAIHYACKVAWWAIATHWLAKR
jgi:hypothetical protein